jgi:hypothetical protein
MEIHKGKVKPHSVDATGVLETMVSRWKPHDVGKLPVKAGLFFDLRIWLPKHLLIGSRHTVSLSSTAGT